MKQIILFILLSVTIASCQMTKVPGLITWDYEYLCARPDTLADFLKYLWKLSDYDSANVQFRVFSRITPDTTIFDSTAFDTLDLVPNKVHETYLLEHKELYIDTTFSFCVQAVLIDTLGQQYKQSKNSDTVHVFIPILPIGVPIELIVIKVPLE